MRPSATTPTVVATAAIVELTDLTPEDAARENVE